MKPSKEKFWFTVGRGAVAHRGEVMWDTTKLIRIKVYKETGKTSLITYLKDRISLIEVW